MVVPISLRHTVGLWLTGSWLLATPAHATECTTPYPIDQLLTDLIQAEDALRSGRNPEALGASEALRGGLLCLSEPMPRMIVGRTYRAIGAGLVATGQIEEGSLWFLTALEAEPTFEYGIEDLPPIHPVRDAYLESQSVEAVEVETLTDRTFADRAWLDGRPIEAVEARPGRPHLLQLDDDPLRSWVIDGSAFPEEATIPVELPGDARRRRSPKPDALEPTPTPSGTNTPIVVSRRSRPTRTRSSTGADGTLTVERDRPKEKTPLILGGLALSAAAGGVYWQSGAKRAEFNQASTLVEITELQPQINRLAIASAALLAAGTGTLTWGVVLSGDGAVGPGLGFRL